MIEDINKASNYIINKVSLWKNTLDIMKFLIYYGLRRRIFCRRESCTLAFVSSS